MHAGAAAGEKLPRAFDVMLKTYRDHVGEIRLLQILTALRTGRTALPSMHRCVFNAVIIPKYAGIPRETGAALAAHKLI